VKPVGKPLLAVIVVVLGLLVVSWALGEALRQRKK